MVLLMQCTKILNWAYSAVDVCKYVDYFISDMVPC